MERDNYWTRTLRRRRLLAGTGTAALGVGALALAGCGDDSTSSSSSGGTKPTTAAGGSPAPEVAKPGGIFRTADITQAAHFSPYHPSADPSFINNWRRDVGYYDKLWNIMDTPDPAKQVQMRLADKIEQPDETTVIVTLKQGVKFHNRAPINGRVMTTEDVMQDIEFLKKPPASGGAFLQSGKDLKLVTSPDPKTLKFEMFGPRAFFFEEMSAARATLVVPKEMLSEDTLKNTPPIGTGPFMYKSHQQGSTEEVTRNPDYWLKDRPYLDGKKITFIPDSAAGEAAFRGGQTDAFGFTDIKQRDSVAADLGKKITVNDYASISGLALVTNIHRKPFDDPRVREAIIRAVNIKRIIDTVYFGDGDPIWYFADAVSTRFPIGRKATEQYTAYDPAKATALLKAAGIDPNKEYELMAPVEAQTWVDSAKLIAEDLAKVGLKVKVNPIVRNVYLQKAGPKPGDFDITMSVLLDYIYMQTDSGTFWNNTSLEDKEVDDLVTKIRSTVDAEARKKLSNQVELMLAQKATPLMPYLTTRLHAAWYTNVKGIDFEAARSGLTGWQINQWQDKS